MVEAIQQPVRFASVVFQHSKHDGKCAFESIDEEMRNQLYEKSDKAPLEWYVEQQKNQNHQYGMYTSMKEYLNKILAFRLCPYHRLGGKAIVTKVMTNQQQ